jgi:hypothetical protein
MTRTNSRRTFRLLASAVAATALVASLSALPGADASASVTAQAQPQQRSSLSTRVPNFSLEDTPLEDALDFLENMTGVGFYVDWQRLEMAGVDRATPVSIQLRGTSVRKTLTLVLDAASPLEPLTFYVDGGMVHITTQEQADSEMVVRVYDVRDLLHVAPDFVGTLQMGGGGGGFGGGGGGLGGGGGGFGGGGGGLGGGGGGYGGGGGGGGLGGAGGSSGGGGMGGSGGGGMGGSGGGGGLGGEGDMSQEERAEELIELIREVIRPDVWRENGGEASIRYFNGNLVVNAPRSVHELL